MKTAGLLLVCLPALAAAPAPPATDPLDALVADSPFLLPGGAGRKSAPGVTGPLELRSILFEDGAYSFSIYDQGSREATWVRLDERDHPFVARSFNRERDALTVDYQGRTVVLTLPPAKMANAPTTPPPAAPPALPNAAEAARAAPRANNAPAAPANEVPPAASAPVPSSNPTEAQRLQALADEVRRRRGTGPQMTEPPKTQP